jgi:predicted nucleic acid-binding protein
MITAVDSSVLLDVFVADKKHVTASQSALRKCLEEGRLVVCEVVVAELRPCFASENALIEALEILGADYHALSREAALLAGHTWARYRQAGGKRDRLIPDFLIAAHAQIDADRLLTRDRGFYKQYYHSLKILEPAD